MLPMPTTSPIKILPPVEYLHECFSYDPGTGELKWKTRPREHFPSEPIWKMWNKQNAGKIITNTTRSGYLRAGRPCWRAHRIIYKLMTGEEPAAIIDHKDGNKLNNRWSNLRPATYSQSTWNAGMHKDNRSGKRGVFLHRGRWQSLIMINGAMRYLGSYATVEDASVAYETVARETRGEFYRQQGG
jgi:hypothetical protein